MCNLEDFLLGAVLGVLVIVGMWLLAEVIMCFYYFPVPTGILIGALILAGYINCYLKRQGRGI